MKENAFRHTIVEFIREIVFGFEDSFVSTLGALTGIAVGAQSTHVVILSGFVLIAAESTSMAAGTYLSSKSSTEAEAEYRKENGEVFEQKGRPARAAVIMGVSYFIGGFVPLAPYFFLSVDQALIPSVVITVLCLFLVGVWAANYTGRSKLRSGLEMVGISLTAALVGYVIGRVVASFFGGVVV